MKTMTQREYEKVMGDHGAKASSAHGFYSSVVAGAGQCATSAAEPYREIPALFKELQAVEAELEDSLQRLFARLAPVTSLYDKSADGRNESCPSPTAQTELGESIRAAVVRLIAMRDLVLNYTAALQL